MSAHPANTIPDEFWRNLRVRAGNAATAERIRFGAANYVRRTRLAGQQYRAAREGRN